MVQNEIAKLITVYDKLWEDLEALCGDIDRIICDEYSWGYFERKMDIDNAYLYSYFSGNKILYFVVDAKEGSLKLALCSTTYRKITSDLLAKNEWGYKKYKFNPFDYYNDDNNNVPKKLSASSCFDDFADNNGDWLFSKIDLMSIDSTEKVNKDVKTLLDIMINGKYKNYNPKSSSLKFI
jgi:hypothetical protein